MRPSGASFRPRERRLFIWLWRAYQARSRSALALGEHDVDITLGNQLRCRFARSSIATAELATWRSVPEMAPDLINAAKPLEPNVMIELREGAEARLPFGIRKRVLRLGLRVGDPVGLLAELRP